MVRTMQAILRAGKNQQPTQASYGNSVRNVSVEEVHEMIGQIIFADAIYNRRRSR